MLRICSCFILLVGLAVPVWAADFSGKVRVIDGDTIDVGKRRVRLHGIDAPERGQPCTTVEGESWSCGDWVTRQVRDRFEGKRARCDQTDTDRYGRSVARCSVGKEDIGHVLVTQGWAFAYRKYSMDYDGVERAAISRDAGIHGYLVDTPARYRLSRRSGSTAPDPGCTIKGNISAKGVRIYHVVGQKYYDKTSITARFGERWFCSEAQARASGWRAAKR